VYFVRLGDKEIVSVFVRFRATYQRTIFFPRVVPGVNAGIR
jgi:hypothetical protein